jgi:demethylmenaquinone methyltransferase/2-methoxy-6-polyprenyl-1,4-benzoquinol methylase
MSEDVKKMFGSIARRYDITNDVLSFGIHRLWKRKAIKLSEAGKRMNILDCASGTGDLARLFSNKVGKDGIVIATDFCPEMLDVARYRLSRTKNIEFEIADVLNLPYKDNEFDASSIAFGIRNVSSPLQCLKEMARVVKPGGKVVVLEFGQPSGLFSVFYKIYSVIFLPIIGKILTGSFSAYSYLQKTSAHFPSGSKFTSLMQETACFKNIESYRLTFGVAYIYVGEVM